MALPPFSYPEPFLRAVNGARRGALAKSISNWHLIGYNEGYCSNTAYILLPCFYGIRLRLSGYGNASPRAYARNGALRRWLGDKHAFEVFKVENLARVLSDWPDAGNIE